MKGVQTVCGPISKDRVGLVDAHGHVWIDQVANPVRIGGPILNNYSAIMAELQAFRQAGGCTIIDCQPGGCGRNAQRLVKLAKDTGVQIVAVTGFHLRHYYPVDHWLWSTTEDTASQLFIRELAQSVAEAKSIEEPIRAGIIKVALPEEPDYRVRSLMRAAAVASKETSCALLFHTERGVWAENISTFFDVLGVSPDCMIICHMDKRPDIGLHVELARAGFLLEYDTFLREKYDPEKNLWPLIEEMVSRGLDSSICIGLDAAQPDQWTFGGGPGLVSLPRMILNRLINIGLPQEVIQRISGINLSNRLSIQE